jgi:hypothetical protein
MENTITLHKQNGQWIGTFSGPLAQPYLYGDLRACLNTIADGAAFLKHEYSSNFDIRPLDERKFFFVLQGKDVIASRNTEADARQHMNENRVLLSVE